MQAQFTEADITAKAVDLGLIQPGEDLPRHHRSRVVAVLLQQADQQEARREQAQPQLAKEIVIYPGGPILVDGEPFPWIVAAEHMDINLDPEPDGLSTVRLTLVTSAVQVIRSEPRPESE